MTVDVSPRTLTLVCRTVALFVVMVFGVLAVVLPQSGTDEQVFRLADQVAFFGIGVLLAACVLAFTRARVRADGQGVWVRNVFGDRFFPWALVVRVDMTEGASWAQLELQDDETVALLAIQSNDGDRAVDAVLALRRLMHNARDSEV